MINPLEVNKKNISDFFSHKSDYWINLYESDENPSSFMRYELISRKKTVFNLFDNLIKDANKKVLDIGCGIGNYLEEVHNRGHKIYGIDIAENMLKTSQKRLKNYFDKPAALCRTDIENLPFSDNSFDVVLCVGVLEYLKEDNKSLNQIARILKPEGILIFTLPNILSLKNFLDPYFIIYKGWKYLFKKFKKSKKNLEIKDIGLNTEFTNRRYRINTVDPILKNNGLNIVSKLSVAYGPPRFCYKDYIPLKTNIKISDYLIKQSNKKIFSFLKSFANRWVICVRKEIE
ncbi:MAG: class I SAM-dependent methyltransferase [Ignavibacterium sp.]|jgi:ubiquinone/menaquinone biosynthesis C-methylase UbiE|nr:class I SAM-dependent methyltransferase [Ignavibacterium sp.]